MVMVIVMVMVIELVLVMLNGDVESNMCCMSNAFCDEALSTRLG